MRLPENFPGIALLTWEIANGVNGIEFQRHCQGRDYDYQSSRMMAQDQADSFLLSCVYFDTRKKSFRIQNQNEET